MKNNPPAPKGNHQRIQSPADFETAISATGYGMYNLLLIMLIIPSAFTVQFESTLQSYIIPAAVCDLNLTMSDRGIINSAVFIGMTMSGPLWGFLLDTVGRRKMIVIGCSLNFLVCIARSFTQTTTYLAICNLLGGSLSGGIYIASVTYIQEFHSMKYRGRVQMIFGVTYGIANLIIPVLASVFLPLKFHITIFNLIEFRPWNLFLMATSSAGLITAISFFFLPESAKFLMSTGQSEEALLVFQKAYAINTRQPLLSYPVLKLEQEKGNSDEEESKKSLKNYVKGGWKQIAPLFNRQYLPKLILVCSVEPLIDMLVNTFRLWLPQIFQSLHEYEINNNGTTASLCTILGVFRPDETNVDAECSVNLENNFSVYFNSMVIAITQICGYSMAGVFINLLGRKKLLIILGVSSTLLAVSIYFSQNVTTLLALASLHLAFTCVCFDIVLTIVVAIFPTTLRATAVSITMLIGRVLTVMGNMVFPILLETSCEAPFAAIAAVMFASTCLTFLLPNTEHKVLE